MRRALLVAGGVAALVLVPAVAASAHPLGNFTVNHYDGLVVTPHAVRDHAVVDTAEIPTQQAHGAVDADHDGAVSAGERTSYADRSCSSLAQALHLVVNNRPALFSVVSASYAYRPGAAGLQTARLDCALTAPAVVTADSTVVFDDTFAAGRIGWHEITAAGAGTHLVRSPVPARSVSDELSHYPNDLLSSPLNVRQASLDVEPGAGRSTLAAGIAQIPGAGPLSRLVERLNSFFSNLAGSRHLTVGVGLLAVLVSLLLGATHAALPGHGKTVMAAYLAGKRGSVRDAVVVGATVTVTHTAGVLTLGLALTASSSLAGDQATRDLGVVSGVLVATIGIGLLSQAVRRLRGRGGHGHGHSHDQADHDGHGPHGHAHPHGHGNADGHGKPRRWGLVGMGVAGGLVPSPSALVVLLGAAALGRTWFGVLLVLTYGIGMAATLTAAGLLLVRLSSRWAGRVATRVSTGRLGSAAPAMTASLVLVVGLGLAARSLAAV
jgi:nickel/cobalt transporter (NicO) family protein